MRSARRAALWTAGRATLFGLVFFGLGLVSERTRFPPFHSASIWLPSGLALAVLVRAKRRRWGAYLAALFVFEMAKVLVAGDVLPLALASAASNCLRSALAAALVCTWAQGRVQLHRLREVIGLALFGGLLAPCVSATLGAAATVRWRADAAPLLQEWSVWWLADSLGTLLLAPLLLTWWPLPRELARPRALAESLLLLGALGVTGFLVFRQAPGLGLVFSLSYLPFPLLAWAALRLGPAGAAAAVALLASLAVGYSVAGRGPFGALVPMSPQARLLAVQAYLAVMGLSSFTLAAMVAERRWAARAQQLLAGLGVLLAEATDDGRTLARIAPSVVPELATGFAAWVVQEDGRLVRVASTGVSASLGASLAERLDAPAGRWVDPEGRAILVPMRVHEQRLGALALVSEDTRRPLGARERGFAEELARRGALALENLRLIARTRQAVHSREEFIGIAAHELRTPLTSLKLQLQALVRMLRRRSATDPALDKLQVLDRQATRLSRLVGSLLDVGRISTGKLELEREEVQLDALAREVAEGLHEGFEQAGCPVLLRLEEDVRGDWDRLRLEQVLTNLLTNAMKFGAGSPIEVEVSRTDDVARLTVRDHGMGMDARALARIFEPFEQAVSAREYGGLGLGLYLTRELVEAHGGQVRASSRPGEGATFTVELPALPPVPARRGMHEPQPVVH